MGDERHDILTAQLMAHMANMKRTKKQKAFRVQDFLIQWGGRKQQSMEDQMEIAKALTVAMGGRIH